MNYLNYLNLLPYQAAFAANPARFKIGLWARQTGKDHTATAEAVLDCLENPGVTWIILAASERQALESLAKAKDWAEILQFDIDEYNVLGRTGAPPVHAGASPACPRLSGAEIKWSNGSRLLALPANPATIRGYSANLILTEFAFHENPDAIWRAIYPTISNPLRGGLKKLRIISTPNGLNNRFAHLWLNSPTLSQTSSQSLSPLSHLNPNLNLTFNPKPNPSGSSPPPFPQLPPVQNSAYFKSKITIHDAIANGLPLDPAELQAGLNDPEAWSQEYLCEFADNSTVLLPYDLIESCESSFASELSSPQALSASALPGAPRPQLFAGLDFARKNHLTVCWILERLPRSADFQSAVWPISNRHPLDQLDTRKSEIRNHKSEILLTREILCLRNLSTPEQLEILRPRLKLCRRVSLDYTGPGIGLGDFLHREFGGGGARLQPSQSGPAGKIELCPLTAPFKAELFPRLAAAFESRELLIPIAREIREDLHSIYRITTNSGQILYRAHSTPDGHADRTTALALALRAAQTTPVSQCANSVGPKYRIFGGAGHGRTLHNSGRTSRPSERTLGIIY